MGIKRRNRCNRCGKPSELKEEYLYKCASVLYGFVLGFSVCKNILCRECHIKNEECKSCIKNIEKYNELLYKDQERESFENKN